MSLTVKCSFCHDIMDAERRAHLNTTRFYVCETCWYSMQEYLTERGFTLLQSEPDISGE
jgi:hypothetical protein